jgi:DNA-binding MarR family transcriptional regulator
MEPKAPAKSAASELFDLPCACQNLRRVTRAVTRIYDQELKKADVEITQFGVLTALATAGEINQKRLSAGFAMDSTTLTRTLAVMRKQGWIEVKSATDRRERLFGLTPSGRQKLAKAQPYWERAESRLRKEVGDTVWKRLKETVSLVTEAALAS